MPRTARLFLLLLIGTLFATTALAECTRCRHNEYGFDDYFDGIEVGIAPSGSPYARVCPSGWTAIGSANPDLCTRPVDETMVYGSEDDVFINCTSERAAHQIWIGGRLNDLVLIGHDRDNLQFFPIRDGGMRCHEDIRQSPLFTVVRYGRLDDLMDIYVPNSDGKSFRRLSYPIQDGVEHDIAVGNQGIVRIYGQLGDVIILYHVDTAFSVSAQPLRLFDGNQHYQIAHVFGDDFVLTLQNLDPTIFMRLCLRDGVWWRSAPTQAPGLTSSGYPLTCDIKVPVQTPPPPPEPRSCGYSGDPVTTIPNAGFVTCCEGLCANNFGVCGSCDEIFVERLEETIDDLN